MRRVIVGAFLCACVTGCFSREPKSLTSDNPDAKIPAIKDAADHHDLSAIPNLIEALDSEDSAIRFAAINALQRLTGSTLDYRYYDDAALRRPAVLRWKAYAADHFGATRPAN